MSATCALSLLGQLLLDVLSCCPRWRPSSRRAAAVRSPTRRPAGGCNERDTRRTGARRRWGCLAALVDSDGCVSCLSLAHVSAARRLHSSQSIVNNEMLSPYSSHVAQRVPSSTSSPTCHHFLDEEALFLFGPWKSNYLLDSGFR